MNRPQPHETTRDTGLQAATTSFIAVVAIVGSRSRLVLKLLYVVRPIARVCYWPVVKFILSV